MKEIRCHIPPRASATRQGCFLRWSVAIEMQVVYYLVPRTDGQSLGSEFYWDQGFSGQELWCYLLFSDTVRKDKKREKIRHCDMDLFFPRLSSVIVKITGEVSTPASPCNMWLFPSLGYHCGVLPLLLLDCKVFQDRDLSLLVFPELIKLPDIWWQKCSSSITMPPTPNFFLQIYFYGRIIKLLEPKLYSPIWVEDLNF